MRSVDNVFNLAHASLKEKDLVQVTKQNYNKVKEITETKMSYEEIRDVMSRNNLNINNLYVTSQGLYNFWYIEGYTYVSLMVIDDLLLREDQYDKIIAKNNKRMNTLWEEGQYDHFFSMLNSSFTFDYFINHMDMIPDNQIYPVFRDIYTKNEYGFRDIDDAIMRKIFSLNKDYRFRKNLHTDSKGYLTIFRGECSKSTCVDKAYSWTLSYDVAVFFAKRFNSVSSKVYQAKVHIDSVIDFIEDRGEKEIIVLPENLKHVKDMELLNFNDKLVDKLRNSADEDYIDKFNYMKIAHIEPDWFERPKGIHGVLHAKRVLILSLIFSFLEKLDERDSNILAISACLHDIGRRNEDKDDYHGILSVQKIDDYSILEDISYYYGFNEEDESIIRAIIRNHAIEDEDGIRDIKDDNEIEQKVRAIRLYKHFKDMDGLDRVRLGDLNVKYIRSESAKKMVLLAYQILDNLR